MINLDQEIKIIFNKKLNRFEVYCSFNKNLLIKKIIGTHQFDFNLKCYYISMYNHGLSKIKRLTHYIHEQELNSWLKVNDIIKERMTGFHQ